MNVLSDQMIRYFERREATRAAAVESVLASLTDREKALVKDAAVMGYINGTMHVPGEPIPRDGRIVTNVIAACLHHPDLYPALGAGGETENCS